ncbi:MAG: Gldg family protein [Bacteroidota bacterium]|nr:Gldg family protein [Bacteroidota bacterium]
MNNAFSHNIRFFLLIIILVFLNILSCFFYFRVDFSSDKRYTLNKITKTTLHNLKEPVTITVFFSENLPPDLNLIKRDFLDILKEFNNVSKNKIKYSLINPGKDELSEKKCQDAGIAPIVINIREKDQLKQQKVYLGAVITKGDKSYSIPYIKSTENMEYDLTSGIIKLSLKNKTKVGLIQGHGEPSKTAISQLNSELSVQYDLEPVYMNDSTPISDTYKTIILLAPSDSINYKQLHYLDNYISKGGNAFIGCNRVVGDINLKIGKSINTGLEKLIESKGVIIEDKFIIDESCGSVTLNRNEGSFKYQTNAQLPYLPMISNFNDHPVTRGISSVLLEFPSPISFRVTKNIEHTVLARTSSKSGLINSPFAFDLNKEWMEKDFPLNELTVACALTENNSNGSKSKMVIISDGDFVTNGENQPVEIQKDNINFVSNAVEWLSDQSGLSSLRTKIITNRPLSQISDNSKNILKYFNFLLPIIIIIAIGIFRMEMNKIKRIKYKQ